MNQAPSFLVVSNFYPFHLSEANKMDNKLSKYNFFLHTKGCA